MLYVKLAVHAEVGEIVCLGRSFGARIRNQYFKFFSNNANFPRSKSLATTESSCNKCNFIISCLPTLGVLPSNSLNPNQLQILKFDLLRN